MKGNLSSYTPVEVECRKDSVIEYTNNVMQELIKVYLEDDIKSIVAKKSGNKHSNGLSLHSVVKKTLLQMIERVEVDILKNRDYHFVDKESERVKKIDEVNKYINRYLSKGAYIYEGSQGALKLFNGHEDSAREFFKENKVELGLVEVTMYRCAHHCVSYTAEEYEELGGELYCDECDGDRFFKTLLFMVEGDRHV